MPERSLKPMVLLKPPLLVVFDELGGDKPWRLLPVGERTTTLVLA
jgi:hypothetical protein